MGGTHTGHSCQLGPRPDKATLVPPAAVGPRVLCDAGGGRGGSSRPPRALAQPWMMLFPESSLSSDGPGGFVPCSQSTPGPWDRGDAGGDTEGVHSCPKVEVHHPPWGRGTTGCKPPHFWPLRGQGPPPPWLGGSCPAQMPENWGRRRGSDRSPPTARQGKPSGGGFVPALLLLPWRDLDPQALCYWGSDKCFQGEDMTGRRGKSWGGEGGCPISLHRDLYSNLRRGSGQASAPRLPGHFFLPVPPLVLASLAGHLHRQKSRGRRRRKDGRSAGPACRIAWEAAAGRRGQGGDVEERFSERGGMGSCFFPSPQSAPGRVSS